MPCWFNFLYVPVLAALAIEDFKNRRVSVWLLAVLGAVVLTSCILYTSSYQDILYGYLFLLMQWVIITVYFSFKSRRYINVFSAYLGTGDAAFLLLVVPLFAFVPFVVYYLFSLTAALLISLVVGPSYLHRGIPLVGFMGFSAIPFLFWQIHIADFFNFMSDIYVSAPY